MTVNEFLINGKRFVKKCLYQQQLFLLWAAGISIGFLLVFCVVYSIFIMPQLGKMSFLVKEVQGSTASVKQLKDYYARIEKSPIESIDFDGLSQYFEFQMTDFYKDHEALLNQYRLQIYSLDFRDPEPLNNGFSKVRFHVKLIGRYKNIGSYLYSLSDRGFLLDYRQLGMEYRNDLGKTIVSLDLDVFFYDKKNNALSANIGRE